MKPTIALHSEQQKVRGGREVKNLDFKAVGVWFEYQ